MPVLLLAQGDPRAKDMLRKAIEARYGLRPVPLESLKLDELAAKRVNEFALILEPLKLKGATGSTVAPIAVH